MKNPNKSPEKTPTACPPLRRRMIEDMAGRGLMPATQRGHIFACKQFAAFLMCSPETATADDIRDFQRHLVDSGRSAIYRNRIMTCVKFLLKVTMRRHDLAAEIYHVREPQTVAVVLAPEEVARVLSDAPGLRARVMLTVTSACGLRGGEVSRLKVSDIDAARHIIRVVESKGRKDRNVMLSTMSACCFEIGGASVQRDMMPGVLQANAGSSQATDAQIARSRVGSRTRPMRST